MYQTGHTIEKTLDEIYHHDLVLPAIQREFVWHPEQIARLFDSLMRGYPFGTFLYWRVDAKNSEEFEFYGFALDYHERDNPHCPRLGPLPNRRLTAVLDGQQRLTALNIGLRGSMAWKLPRLWWDNPNAFPKRQLYLDLLWQTDGDNDDASTYRFEFLTKAQVDGADETTCWFPVPHVLQLANAGPAMTKWLNSRLPQEQVDQAYELLYRLFHVVRTEHLVAYYEVVDQNLHTVLQIFIRMNSGGTVLSYSDLLLSVAVAQWQEHDAREEIHGLVDQLNGIGDGFSFSKDIVLKAGLMLSDIGSVGFKVDNFNSKNMDIFEKNWAGIKRALTLTVELVADFGFNGRTLTAHNAILPISYYLYKTERKSNYRTSSRFDDDRDFLREWLIRSLLKRGIWGSGLDTLLTELRGTIRRNSDDSFPDRIYKTMRRAGKSLAFEDEDIEELVDMRYQDRLAFALLFLLFPYVKLRDQFHVDHVFPQTRFSSSKLKRAGVPTEKVDDFIDHKDRLANLQLLPGTENIEKRAKLPFKWLSGQFPNEEAEREYRRSHLLEELPESIVDFDNFYDKRRKRMKKSIQKLLG